MDACSPCDGERGGDRITSSLIFNEKSMVFLITLSLIFICFTSSYAQYKQQEYQRVIKFFFRIYRNDSVELLKLEESLGYITSTNIGEYEVKIVSKEGEILYESPVDIFFLYNKTKKEGVLLNYSLKDFVDVYLSLPYFSNARKIELYHFNKLIYEKEVPFEEETITEEAESCGNAVCEEWEDFTNCPIDCFQQTTLTQVLTKTQKEEIKPHFYSILIVLIISLILLLFLLIKTKMSEKYVK
ncbi:MAG: hypothetical protein QXR09_04140 [Candidatus Aenigmatarchaeota archaeon]